MHQGTILDIARMRWGGHFSCPGQFERRGQGWSDVMYIRILMCKSKVNEEPPNYDSTLLFYCVWNVIINSVQYTHKEFCFSLCIISRKWEVIFTKEATFTKVIFDYYTFGLLTHKLWSKLLLKNHAFSPQIRKVLIVCTLLTKDMLHIIFMSEASWLQEF